MTDDLAPDDLAEQRRRSRLEWEACIAELRLQAIREGRAQPTDEERAAIGEDRR